MKIKYWDPQFNRPLRDIPPGTVVSIAGSVMVIIDDPSEYLTSERAQGDLVPCLELKSGILTMLDADMLATPRPDAVLTFEGSTDTN